MKTTISLENMTKPAPRWFRRSKKAIHILVVAANTMVASWGFPDELLVVRLQLWCTIGIHAVMEALEAVLSNGEEYVQTKDDKPV